MAAPGPRARLGWPLLLLVGLLCQGPSQTPLAAAADAPCGGPGVVAIGCPTNSATSLCLNTTDGRFSLHVGGQLWAESPLVAFHLDHVWYSSSSSAASANASRIVVAGVSSRPTAPVRGFGVGSAVELHWATAPEARDNHASNATTVLATTRIVFFEAVGAIVFEQEFPRRVAGAALGVDSMPWGCFPTLDPRSGRMAQLGFLTQRHIFGNAAHGVGLVAYPGDIQGGTPLALFDADSIASQTGREAATPANVAVLSPLSNFKTSVQAVAAAGPAAGLWAAGLNGLVDAVPGNTTVHSTVLMAGTGLHATLERWGQALLARGGKNATAAVPGKGDVTADKLSFWLDNGAWNYYHPDAIDYQATLRELHAALAAQHVPVRSYQLDSWWYFKHLYFDGGLELWEPRKLGIFPEGIEAVQRDLGGVPLTMHNRWFSSASDYMSRFPFATQGEWAFPAGGLANVTALYRYLLRFADTWGLAVYEQDWMTNSFMHVDFARSDPDAANHWLWGMGAAAEERGLQVQYCMPLPSDYLASTQVPAVSQIRVSNDYAVTPGNWKIGQSSVFAWAVGLRPFKDVFWTTTKEYGNLFYPRREEPNPLLQAVVATMSTGPVGIGDKKDLINVTIVNMTCTPDGTLLTPSRPMLAIEPTFTAAAPAGEVWSTFSEIRTPGSISGVAARWFFVLSAALAAPYKATPGTVGMPAAANATVCTWPGLDSCAPFSATAPLVLPASPEDPKTHKTDFHLFVAPPRLAAASAAGPAWRLLGEVSKITPVSVQRFRYVAVSASQLSVALNGWPGEQVTLAFVQESASPTTIHRVTCSVSPANTTTVIIPATGSATCAPTQ